jgi:hypothetical protein
MKAYLAEFRTYVIAATPAEATERLRVWSALAKSAGFEPGAGTVKPVKEGDTPHAVQSMLETARAKVQGVANDRQRRRAIESLASHLAGDISLSTEVVASIEHETGPLPANVADALTAAWKRPEAA